MWHTSDDERFDQYTRTHHTITARVELWSESTMLSDSVEFEDGEVSAKRVRAGVQSTLRLVTNDRHWRRWLDYPALELRPYRGIQFRPGKIVEVPLYRFPMPLPTLNLVATEPLDLNLSDYYEWVMSADFTRKPARRPAGRLTSAIRYLLRGAGLESRDISTSYITARSGLLKDTRHDAIVDLARSAAVEVALDRRGVPIIQNLRKLGTATSTALTGNGQSAVGAWVEPDWTGVYNVVTATTSAPDVNLPAAVVQITDPAHPAHPHRLGSVARPRYRVYAYNSNLIKDASQLLRVARSLLARHSQAALSYSYLVLPDVRRDPGDSILGAATTGPVTSQIETITHPLRAALSKITTSPTVYDEDDL